MLRFAWMVCLVGLAVGCASQSREDRSVEMSNQQVNTDVRLHGASGYEIATIFNSGKTGDIMSYEDRQATGLRTEEFYVIEVAPDPTKPTVVDTTGFVVKLGDQLDDGFYYKFYTDGWNLIGALFKSGALYEYGDGREQYVGDFHFDGAINYFYAGGLIYSDDRAKVDASRMRMGDSEVAEAGPMGRGIRHRRLEATVKATRLSPGDARVRAGELQRDRHDRYQSERLAQLRKERRDIEDGDYHGTEFKDGEPVDENGKPLPRPNNGR